MTNAPSRTRDIPAWRAVITGTVVALASANVWPLLLLSLGVPLGAAAETVFLVLFGFWAAGAGPPGRTSRARAARFRRIRLTGAGWAWGLVGAVGFAVTIHAAVTLLFRLVPYPTEAFRQGYVLPISSAALKWLAIVMSVLSASICEEVGFRGYLPFNSRLLMHSGPFAARRWRRHPVLEAGAQGRAGAWKCERPH